MNLGTGLLILGVVGGAVAAGVSLSNKEQAAADLSISPDGVELNPKKNVKGTNLEIPVWIKFSNIHGTKLTVNAVDLQVVVNGKTLATIQDYKGWVIKGVTTTRQRLVAKTGVINMAIVLTTAVIRAIGGLRDGQSLKELLPKKAKLTGFVRAEGIVFPLDEEVDISV